MRLTSGARRIASSNSERTSPEGKPNSASEIAIHSWRLARTSSEAGSSRARCAQSPAFIKLVPKQVMMSEEEVGPYARGPVPNCPREVFSRGGVHAIAESATCDQHCFISWVKGESQIVIPERGLILTDPLVTEPKKHRQSNPSGIDRWKFLRVGALQFIRCSLQKLD